MATEFSAKRPIPQPVRSSSTAWLYARQMWAGLSIIMMWIAVLFVGIFGPDFVSSDAGGGFTRIPVVVFVLPFVLPATIAVARRGLVRGTDEAPPATHEETRGAEGPVAEAPAMQTRSAA